MTYNRLSTQGANDFNNSSAKKNRKNRKRQELDAANGSHGCCVFSRPRFGYFSSSQKKGAKRTNTTEAKITRAKTKKTKEPEYDKQLDQMKHFINENLNISNSEVLDQTIENMRPSDLSIWKTSVKSSNILSVDDLQQSSQQRAE